MKPGEFGKTGLKIPPVVFGTSSLGNLFTALPRETKHSIISEWFQQGLATVVADSAGKYGAGLSLEVMGEALTALGVDPDHVVISNKLGWRRAPLTGPEPTFEPGAWVDLEYDAVQDISYDGILRCWEEGNELLGAYRSQMVSVHDPDEYLAAAESEADRQKRWDDILEAYRALAELKANGQACGVGVGSKDWTVIRDISHQVDLDWVMFANSFTIMNHPPELMAFFESLAEKNVGIINSAVFHAGFLVGGDHFDYQRVDPATEKGRQRLAWRDTFNGICQTHDVLPAHACIKFGASPPAIGALALSSGDPARVGKNVAAVNAEIPTAFWKELKDQGLVDSSYPYLG